MAVKKKGGEQEQAARIRSGVVSPGAFLPPPFLPASYLCDGGGRGCSNLVLLTPPLRYPALPCASSSPPCPPPYLL